MVKMKILSRNSENRTDIGKLTERLFSDYCAQLWPMTSCIINASSRREPANCSIKTFLYRTTFGNDHLQLAENTENDRKFASSKRKCDRPSPWKAANMRRNKMKKIALFSILAIKKVIGRWFQKWENWLIFQIGSGNGPKIRRITIYGGELTGMRSCLAVRSLLVVVDVNCEHSVNTSQPTL